jgi:phenylacetate-coenzyme A ligase PaaK-like adenylate-forming protein
MKKPYYSDKYYKNSTEALDIALETAPAYRSWKEFDPGKDTSIDERYAAMPVLTKKEIREHFPGGVVPHGKNLAEGIENGEIEFVETSGTTAEKITNVWNQHWWNASEAASWKLNVHSSHLNHTFREAQLASALSVGFNSSDDLPMHARILNERFLFLNEKVSAHEWTDVHYERMIRELREFKPAVLEGNPSLISRLAWWAIDNKMKVYQPQVVLFTYELPSALQLRGIKKVFGVPMASSYGSTETGYVFMQCEHGTFHQNTDFCRVDFEPLMDLHGGPALGRILVTTFHNPWTSLIRFDVGDLVRLHESGLCPCGRREGLMLDSIEGRAANAVFTTQGSLVTTKQLDDILAGSEVIRDYHLDQLSNKEYNFKIIALNNSDTFKVKILNEMYSLFGNDASINIEFCKDILPGPSGKYRRTGAHFDFDSASLFKQ